MRIYLLCLIFLITSQVLAENRLVNELSSFSKQLTENSSVIVYDLKKNREIFQHNSDLPLKPASIMKILTSLVALKELGPHFQYHTEIKGSAIASGVVDEVEIVGRGDPFFRIEELFLLVRRLKLLNISKIKKINFNTSAFEDLQERYGTRAYEAAASALAFNFNSIRIQVCPTIAGKSAHVVVDPYEYRVRFVGQIDSVKGAQAKYAVDEIQPGVYRINGSVGVNLPCADHYRSVPNPVNYLEQVLKYQLNAAGIKVNQITEGLGKLPTAWNFSFKSKDLVSIITDLNHYSSNFVAEQVLFALGLTNTGKYNRAAGLSRLQSGIQRLQPGTQVQIEDSSGLSHENRVPSRLILAALIDFWNNPALKPEFERSLAVQGRSGTLKNRQSPNGLIVRGKTGSLTGVSSLAGYVYTHQQGTYAFVIIQNSKAGRNDFIAAENRFLKILNQ